MSEAAKVTYDLGMSEDDVLAFTQIKRKKLVENLTAEGMPVDKDERRDLLHTLADMDRTALSQKRLGVDQGQLDSDRLVAEALLKIGQQFENSDPFAVSNPTRVIEHEPDLAQLPSVELVPGEGDIGLATETHAEFIKKFEE